MAQVLGTSRGGVSGDGSVRDPILAFLRLVKTRLLVITVISFEA